MDYPTLLYVIWMSLLAYVLGRTVASGSDD